MVGHDYRMPRITSAMLVLTHGCNLECRYCFVQQNPCHMTFETAMRATNFLIQNADRENLVPSINFFGGEPMLMWDEIIVPLTNWIRNEYQKPFSLSITTNGTLLNKERIEFLTQNRMGVLLSIDGDKETQDYNRPLHNGGSSFDILKDVIPLIVEYRPGTTFRMTTIPKTCEHVFENIQFAQESGFKSFFVIPNVFEKWSDEKRGILAKEMRKYSDYYIESFRDGVEPIRFSEIDKGFVAIRQINSAIDAKEYRTSNKCKSYGKCGLGASRFASIDPNGNLYACQEMTSNEGEQSIFYIGNIFDGERDDLRYRLMNLYDSSQASGEDCSSCKLNRVCDGGCVANNYMITGSVNKLPEMYCWWQQLVIDEAIYIMQTLGKEENEAFRKKWSNVR